MKISLMIVSQLKFERRISAIPVTITVSWAELHNGLKKKNE
jgi:hypothetical protein